MPDIRAALQNGLTGSCTIERELGRGGMAWVFLARDLRHDRLVALKVLDPALAASIGTDRFLREIRVAARLQHPHILTIHDSGELPASGPDPALLWFTMPYVEGESLRQRLTREGQLPLADAVTIAREVADALAYAHDHAILHRDIKPENLLLSGGHTMVADFGVARALGDEAQHLTGTGMAVGTPAYMSPEQATGGHAIDARSDVYALGCVLYEMLAGEPPFTGRTPAQVVSRILTESYRPLRSMRETVTPALEQVVATALARAPADRYASAAEMARALRPEVATPSALPLATTAAPPASGLQPRKSRLAVIAAVGALALLALIAVRLLGGRGGAPTGMNSNLVAVAPFDLVSSDPDVTVWGEGIVDVVSRYFDGAGTLEAVAPTRAVRAWAGRADQESAARFGEALSARYVIYGQLVGSDTVRLTATLLDLADSTVLDEHEWRGADLRVDRMADSLATRFLDVLGRTRQLGVVRSDPIGTSDPLAIRAFLSGMRDFRRAAYREAEQNFVAAVAQDTGFVLARLYASQAAGWQHGGRDTVTVRLGLEAGIRNRGLTPRDSLLILGDSLDAAIYQTRGPAFGLNRRLGQVMETLIASHSQDPEVLYWVGDENYHMNPMGKRERWHLEQFKRAIDLDPLFAPAYEHAVELSAMLDPPEETRALIGRMLSIPGIDSGKAEALRVTDRLLDPALPASARQAVLDSVPQPMLSRVRSYLFRSPDSVATMAARTVARRFPSPAARARLLHELAYHGRLQEVTRMLPTVGSAQRTVVSVELAVLEVIPLAAVDSLFDALWDAPPGPPGPIMGVRLWLPAGDTMRLRRMRDRFAAARARAPPDQREAMAMATEWAQGWLALAQGDSTGWRERWSRRMDIMSPGMAAETPLGLLMLDFARAFGSEEDTWVLLQSRQSGALTAVLWMLQRARMAEQRGEREMALDDYGFVARLWENADEPLRSYAVAAKEGLARLSAEPRPGR